MEERPPSGEVKDEEGEVGGRKESDLALANGWMKSKDLIQIECPLDSTEERGVIRVKLGHNQREGFPSQWPRSISCCRLSTESILRRLLVRYPVSPNATQKQSEVKSQPHHLNW